MSTYYPFLHFYEGMALCCLYGCCCLCCVAQCVVLSSNKFIVVGKDDLKGLIQLLALCTNNWGQEGDMSALLNQFQNKYLSVCLCFCL